MKDLTSEELAYLAGFIDSDGCIYINKMKHPERDYYSIVVALAQTNFACMEWISEKLEKHASTYKVKSGKPYMRVALYGIKAQELLRLILPYVIGKRDEIETALDFPAKERGDPPDSEEVEHQEYLYRELKAIHKRPWILD